MSLFNSVIWQDGMFMKPHHFQQLERAIQKDRALNAELINPLHWGVRTLELDQQLLKVGKFALAASEGILPDNTPFSFPSLTTAPAPLSISNEDEGKVVYLCCPLPSAQQETYSTGLSLGRYNIAEKEVVDTCYDINSKATLIVGKLKFYLKLEG
ncbi:type VI secretion system baseplate subunit TssK, partial [Vibrio sp.]|nr:type VI secretion system baseplate subunit TssK [Vibrio sp.]